MNWLDLARAGENCPQATERSFSAHERAKWERAAEYTNRSGGTAPGCEPGDLPDYPGVTAGKNEHDRARERTAKKMPPWPLAVQGLSPWYVPGPVEAWRDAALARIASLEESLRIYVKLYTDSHSVEFEQRDQIKALERKLDLAHEAVRGRNDLAEAAQALGELWDGLMAGRQHSYVVRAAIEKIKALEAENARLLGMGIDQATRLETLAQFYKDARAVVDGLWTDKTPIEALRLLRSGYDNVCADAKGLRESSAAARRDEQGEKEETGTVNAPLNAHLPCGRTTFLRQHTDANSPVSSPSPAAGSARERELHDGTDYNVAQWNAAREIVAVVWHCTTSLDPYDDDADLLSRDMEKYGSRFCAEIAKHAHLFVQDPKEGERSAMREVRPETSASSEPLGSALSDDEIGSRIMNGLGGEKYDPSDLMPWERRVGKRARALFAPPAPVAVTRERIKAALAEGERAYYRKYPPVVMTLRESQADAVLSALSASVSAEDVERACKAHWERDGLQIKWETLNESQRAYQRKDMRAALKSLGIATEGT